MTTATFRVDDAEATDAQRWADRLGIDTSELLREALRRHLVHLAAEFDAERRANTPLTDNELSLAAIADWGRAEDWSDWADASR